METIEINKTAILKLKESIKNASEKQKFYKDQRKLVHNKLPREISPGEATWKHSSNRRILRIMYAAYAVMRGRKITDVDQLRFDEEWMVNDFNNSVKRMVEMYEKEAVKKPEKSEV